MQLTASLKEERKKRTRVEADLEAARDKLQTASSLSRDSVSKMETELAELRSTTASVCMWIGGGAMLSTSCHHSLNPLPPPPPQLKTQLLELETKNDELENNLRQAEMSREAAEAQANEQLESNAFLQSDLEEQQETVAHLREELRGECDCLGKGAAPHSSACAVCLLPHLHGGVAVANAQSSPQNSRTRRRFCVPGPRRRPQQASRRPKPPSSCRRPKPGWQH